MNDRVTVRFDLPCRADGYTRSELTAMQDALIARSGVQMRIIWRFFNGMNGVSAYINRADLQKLRSSAGVISVYNEVQNETQ
ncbi:MAG: protease inhibitor I9 family protein [Clostridia bacterium]|nr:protease inhibitor I9 family protein [Clostridia bacterium]